MHRKYVGINDVAFSMYAAQWRDEEDYIEALETVKATLASWRAGAVHFFIAGDVNIELRPGSAEEDLHGLDSFERRGLGREDVITNEKKLRWLQLLKEFNCTATSTCGRGAGTHGDVF